MTYPSGARNGVGLGVAGPENVQDTWRRSRRLSWRRRSPWTKTSDNTALRSYAVPRSRSAHVLGLPYCGRCRAKFQ